MSDPGSAPLRVIIAADFASPELASAAAYATKAMMIVGPGEIIPLICNPSEGDDFAAMCAWASAGHMICAGGELFVQVAAGHHYVNTQISATDGRVLDVRGASTPDERIITGITFAAVSATVYDATVTVSSPLPDQAVVGSVVGLRDVQGNGGAASVNGGHIIRSISGNCFVVRIQVVGPAPTNATSFTNTLLPIIDQPVNGVNPSNRAIFPKSGIRADQAGWDGGGAPYEGFMEARSGGNILLRDIGLSYDNTTTGRDQNEDDDMLFAHGAGSSISMVDKCVVAGTAKMIARSFNYGHIHAYGSCLGGGETGAMFWQGTGGGTAVFQRSMIGSVSGIGISATAAASAYIDKLSLIHI